MVLREILLIGDADLNTWLPPHRCCGFVLSMEIKRFCSRQVDRLWRKNRRPILLTGSGKAVGVDLNRNFATKNWGA